MNHETGGGPTFAKWKVKCCCVGHPLLREIAVDLSQTEGMMGREGKLTKGQ